MPTPHLSSDQIHVVDMGQYFSRRSISNAGPTVYYTALSRHTLKTVNVSTGEFVTIWDADQADPGLVVVDESSRYVIWNEWHGEHGKVLYRRNIATGEQVEIDRWTDPGQRCIADHPSSLAVANGRIAYSIVDPTDGNPLASWVVVRDLDTLAEIGRARTQMQVFGIGIAGDAIIYGEGHAGGGPYCLGGADRLMYARLAGGDPEQLGEDPGDIIGDDQRLIWRVGQHYVLADASALGTVGPAYVPTEMNAQMDTFALGEGLISWVQPGEELGDIVVQDPTTSRSVIVANGGIDISSIGGGWLTWTGYSDVGGGYESGGMWGVNLDDVRAAMGS